MNINFLNAKNLLPQQGKVFCFDDFLSSEMAVYYFSILEKEILWAPDEIKMFGKTIYTKRLVAWYGEELLPYTYSKTTKYAQPWIQTLLSLKHEIETKTNESFNACLLNYYPSGKEGMGWHSDDEKDIVEDSAIASLSLGAERKFVFKNKISQEIVEVFLKNGSLLLMKNEIQKHWLHSLPKSAKISQPRINLTFRKMLK